MPAVELDLGRRVLLERLTVFLFCGKLIVSLIINVLSLSSCYYSGQFS